MVATRAAIEESTLEPFHVVSRGEFRCYDGRGRCLYTCDIRPGVKLIGMVVVEIRPEAHGDRPMCFRGDTEWMPRA
jgi:hypothetical protein